MKKFWEILKKNIFLSIMSLFVLIGGIIILVVTVKFFISGNNEYGTRLKGIEKVEITRKAMTKIASTIEENEKIEDVNIRLQGRIIYITINYKEGTSIDEAKNIASSTLENFDDDEKNFYDIGYFLTSSGENGINITGNKKAKNESISFIRS